MNENVFPALMDDSRKSIAVLPFTNLSDQHESDFYGDGITEEIITVLPGCHDRGPCFSREKKAQ